MRSIILLVAGTALFVAPAWGHKTGADPGYTGAPDENNCTYCHVGTAVNGGSGGVKVELVGATAYTPGVRHTLRVTVTESGVTRWGFQLSARLKGTSNRAGTFNVADPVNTRLDTGQNGLEYVTHTEAGTQAGTASPASWTVEWTAPPSGAGPVVFYVAGNAANRDGASTSDKIYTSSTEIEASDGTPVDTKSYVLPQVAIGGEVGRWWTTLYFTNTGTSTASFTVDFYNDNGTPMTVPVEGGATSSLPVFISAGATYKTVLTSTGALSQGWASVRMPSSVKGFGVFSLSVNGNAAQEAVVPLSEDSAQSYSMIWDDAGFDTSMAVANPGDTAVAVNLTVRLASGTQIGTGTIILGPKEKRAFVARTQLNLPAMLGASGSMDVSVQSGKLSLLGLRFGPLAFTSIPPAER